MPKPTISTATTHWEGNLFQGKGQTELTTSGVATFDVSWAKRAEAGQGNTNPEELLAASLATCSSIDTQAAVTFVAGQGVTGITISVSGDVPGLDADGFKAKAEWAKDNCPISQALKAVPKELVVR